jgi:hypothetical protein
MEFQGLIALNRPMGGSLDTMLIDTNRPVHSHVLALAIYRCGE